MGIRGWSCSSWRIAAALDPTDDLADLGLEPSDSAIASDHLPHVADVMLTD